MNEWNLQRRRDQMQREMLDELLFLKLLYLNKFSRIVHAFASAFYGPLMFVRCLN